MPHNIKHWGWNHAHCFEAHVSWENKWEELRHLQDDPIDTYLFWWYFMTVWLWATSDWIMTSFTARNTYSRIEISIKIITYCIIVFCKIIIIHRITSYHSKCFCTQLNWCLPCSKKGIHLNGFSALCQTIRLSRDFANVYYLILRWSFITI